MRILIACEFSGIVREAFKRKGHDAWSCDLLPTEIPGQHIQGDVLEILNDNWDMMIAHPPCTYLSYAGLHYNKNNPNRQNKTKLAVEFVLKLWNSNIPKICIENPRGYLQNWRKPDMEIHPYYFGDSELKRTCLWLKNIPPLMITGLMEKPKPYHSIIRKSGGKKGKVYNYYFHQNKTAHERSRTFKGIAEAMANQWG